MSSSNINHEDGDGEDDQPIADVQTQHHDPWTVIAGVAGNMLEVCYDINGLFLRLLLFMFLGVAC